MIRLCAGYLEFFVVVVFFAFSVKLHKDLVLIQISVHKCVMN